MLLKSILFLFCENKRRPRISATLEQAPHFYKWEKFKHHGAYSSNYGTCSLLHRSSNKHLGGKYEVCIIHICLTSSQLENSKVCSYKLEISYLQCEKLTASSIHDILCTIRPCYFQDIYLESRTVSFYTILLTINNLHGISE